MRLWLVMVGLYIYISFLTFYSMFEESFKRFIYIDIREASNEVRNLKFLYFLATEGIYTVLCLLTGLYPPSF